MIRKSRKVPAPIVLTGILAVAVLSGCATKGDIDALRSQIDSLQQSTTEALAEAKAAKELSNANQLELDSVRITAQSAVQLAGDNDLKINRAFKKSLNK